MFFQNRTAVFLKTELNLKNPFRTSLIDTFSAAVDRKNWCVVAGQ